MDAAQGEGWLDVSAILGPGVYALLFAEEVVYIGKARRLLARLYAHRNLLERKRSGVRGIKAVAFSKVRVFPCAEVDLDRVERELIERHRPKYNTQYVKPMPTGETIKLTIGGIDLEIGGVRARPVVIERRF
jgi:excinuclease UvrABC nuclease subunit